MAISITPEQFSPEKKRAASVTGLVEGVDRFLLWMSLAVLVIVSGSWFALTVFTAKIHRDTAVLEEGLFARQRSRSPKIEAELRALAARALAVPKILQSHRDARETFVFLEQRVQPGITFSNLSVDYEKRTVALTVTGSSFSHVAKQIVAFEQDTRVLSVKTGSVSRGEGDDPARGTQASSNVALTFSEDAFRADLSQ